MTDEVLAGAVDRSGYPLETVVAAMLSKAFTVYEEWSYSGNAADDKSRSLDVMAWHDLFDDATSPPIRPALALLVECKRSELPWVLFRGAAVERLQYPPEVIGVRFNSVALRTRENSKSVGVPLIVALGLESHSFIRTPPLCTRASRAVWKKGNDKSPLDLTGSDPYHEVVMPLGQALEHAMTMYRGRANTPPYRPVLALPVCVLDAPLVVGSSDPDRTELTLQSWVRLVRQETRALSADKRSFRRFSVDVVHRDFLATFIADHVLPFATEFARRATEKVKVIDGAGGIVGDVASFTWSAIEPLPKMIQDAEGALREARPGE